MRKDKKMRIVVLILLAGLLNGCCEVYCAGQTVASHYWCAGKPPCNAEGFRPVPLHEIVDGGTASKG